MPTPHLKPFHFAPPGCKVIFGDNALPEIATEVAALGSRGLVVCSHGKRNLAEQAKALLGNLCVGIFDGAVMHVPIEAVKEARAETIRLGADCLIAIGGGSAIGMAKAIALQLALPILAVPTTYAGSEMTPVWGITENALKTTGRSAQVRPRTAIYDPLLTLTLPASVAAVSGMNAIAHCVEALYSDSTNPVVTLLAAEGIRALAGSLPAIANDPNSLSARGEALYGAWLGGMSLGAVGMALHHKICHTLGGSFGLPHAEVHAVVLPHVVAFNAGAAPRAMTLIADALGCQDAALGLYDLLLRLEAPTSLRQLGLSATDIDRCTVAVLANPYYNPQAVTHQALRDLIERAYHGNRPDEHG